MAEQPSQTLSLPQEDLFVEASGEAEPLSPEERPDMEHIETEDDTPVDNLLSAKNQRLLVEPLYSAWSPPDEVEHFLADANVGVFYADKLPPLVPDAFLSLDVQVADNWWEKRHRSYFIWEFGKPPDVVVEIVSNQKGEEDTRKLRLYARIKIPYYAIYDPLEQLGPEPLRLFGLHGTGYVPLPGPWLPGMGVGLTLWTGTYEGKDDTWLRWCDEDGIVIPTGKELAEREREEKEREREEKEREREEKEREREEKERERQEKEEALASLEQMKARLRDMGIEP